MRPNHKLRIKAADRTYHERIALEMSRTHHRRTGRLKAYRYGDVSYLRLVAECRIHGQSAETEADLLILREALDTLGEA